MVYILIIMCPTDLDKVKIDYKSEIQGPMPQWIG